LNRFDPVVAAEAVNKFNAAMLGSDPVMLEIFTPFNISDPVMVADTIFILYKYLFYLNFCINIDHCISTVAP
jgi:hypothetical protein